MTDQSNREAWAAADDYSAFLGDGNLGLVLSLEQGRELAPAAATVARAWSNKVRNRLQFLLAHAELSLEVLLARDAFQRGIVTREFCEEMQAQAALPEEDNLVLPLAARGDENDLFDNPEFVALGLKILDPAAAETFRAFLDQRPSNPFPKELPMLLEELKDEWSRLGTLALRGDAGEEPEVPEGGPHEK